MPTKPRPPVVAPDGLLASQVRNWIDDKHATLTSYVEISRYVRKKDLAKKHRPAFIDLYCDYGVSYIADDQRFTDGSPLAAWQASRLGDGPFAEFHICDTDSTKLNTCTQRLEARGARVFSYNMTAADAAPVIAKKLDRYALHLAFVDPYKLSVMPFSIFESLSALHRIDFIVHFSTMHLQRAFSELEADGFHLDAVAPGWRSVVTDNTFSGRKPTRAARDSIFRHWQSLLVDLDRQPARSVRSIKNSRNGLLYRLVLASRHDLARKFWAAIERDPTPDLFGH